MFNRYREQGSTSLTSGTQSGTYCDGVGSYTNTVDAHRVGTVRGMWDVVTPGFKRRSNAGEVINSPMTSVVQTFDGGGSGNSTSRPCTPPLSHVIATQDWGVSMRIFNPGFVFSEVRGSDGRLTYPAFACDVENLRAIASTKAMAAVSASTATGLLMLGEMGKTLQFLLNPISSMTRYLSRLPDMRRGKAKGAVDAVASQYLAYYYGLKPLMMDVEASLDAMLSVLEPVRETARGSASDSLTSTATEFYGGCSRYTNSFTYTEEVSVRAGNLYEVSHSTGRDWGLRVSDIPSTAWDLFPFSFVVDWAYNIGDFIAALSPMPGVKYLSSWDVIRVKQTHRAETIDSVNVCPPTVQDRTGSEWASRVIETTIRSPKNPWSNVRIARKPIHFGAEKTLAALSLFTSLALGRLK